MTDMDDLVAWVRAQIDEDERVATKAKAMRYELPTDAPWERERLIADRVSGASNAVAVHRMIAIFANPDRVLAEVAFKRWILAEYEQASAPYAYRPEPYAGRVRATAIVMERSIRVMAQQVYAGRPDWQESWKA